LSKSKDIAITILAHTKGNMIAYVQYSGSSLDALKPLLMEATKPL
jgi:hypothetical protein